VCTVSSIGNTGASWAVSDRSATITESCASLAMNAIWSADSRMFSVCRTAPMAGAARYTARCSALFHMNVATR
jgi:hypothetical protein